MRSSDKLEHKYINEFLACKCAPDMLRLKLFPNGKEITESFACYDAVKSQLLRHYQLGDPRVIMLSVGDGATPRTAATFAFRSTWTCHSIDPALGTKTRFDSVARLRLHAKKIEDCRRDDFKIHDDATVVLAAIHSHATLDAAVRVIGPVSRLAIVAIPCCVKLSLARPTLDVYHDAGIWSPHKTVLLWDLT